MTVTSGQHYDDFRADIRANPYHILKKYMNNLERDFIMDGLDEADDPITADSGTATIAGRAAGRQRQGRGGGQVQPPLSGTQDYERPASEPAMQLLQKRCPVAHLPIKIRFKDRMGQFPTWTAGYIGLVRWLFEAGHLNAESAIDMSEKSGLKTRLFAPCSLPQDKNHTFNGFSYRSLGGGIALCTHLPSDTKRRRILELYRHLGLSADIVFWQDMSLPAPPPKKGGSQNQTTLTQSQSIWQTLTKACPRSTPTKIKFRGREAHLNTWSRAYVEIVIWLLRDGHLDVASIRQGRALLKGRRPVLLKCDITDAVKTYKINGSDYKALGSLGIGLLTNQSTPEKWKTMLWLCGQAGIDPAEITFMQ